MPWCNPLSLQHTASSIAGAEGGSAALVQHCGSSLLLLALLQVCNSALWMLLYSLHSRLLVRWGCVGLPALAVLPLCHSGRVCQELLHTPGTLPALERLHRVLALTQ